MIQKHNKQAYSEMLTSEHYSHLVSCGGNSNASHWLLGCLFQLGIICVLHQTKVSQDISQVIMIFCTQA